MEVDWHKLYKKQREEIEFYKSAYLRESHMAGKHAAELEKRKKDEARAFLRGVYVACVTFLVVVGIVAACVEAAR